MKKSGIRRTFFYGFSGLIRRHPHWRANVSHTLPAGRDWSGFAIPTLLAWRFKIALPGTFGLQTRMSAGAEINCDFLHAFKKRKFNSEPALALA